MDKKHISIIGSCVSREMFNTSTLQDLFQIDRYAFRNCIWDLFSDGLDIDKNLITNLDIPEFSSRMIWYELDKVALTEIQKYNSEYLLVDLLNIYYSVDKVSYKDKSIYAQDMFDGVRRYFPKLCELDELKTGGISLEKLGINEIDKSLIETGLKKFAEWIKSNFDLNKVIINKFGYGKGFYNLNNEYIQYTPEQYSQYKRNYEFALNWTDFLINLLPGVKVLEPKFQLVCHYGNYDELTPNYVSPVHFTIE